MRKLVAAGVLFLALSGVSAFAMPVRAQTQPKLTASVGYYPGALISLPAFIASDQNFFAKEGLAVELVPISTGPAMTSAPAPSSAK